MCVVIYLSLPLQSVLKTPAHCKIVLPVVNWFTFNTDQCSVTGLPMLNDFSAVFNISDAQRQKNDCL
jgi:hypothetical protein